MSRAASNLVRAIGWCIPMGVLGFLSFTQLLMLLKPGQGPPPGGSSLAKGLGLAAVGLVLSFGLIPWLSGMKRVYRGRYFWFIGVTAALSASGAAWLVFLSP